MDVFSEPDDETNAALSHCVSQRNLTTPNINIGDSASFRIEDSQIGTSTDADNLDDRFQLVTEEQEQEWLNDMVPMQTRYQNQWALNVSKIL